MSHIGGVDKHLVCYSQTDTLSNLAHKLDYILATTSATRKSLIIPSQWHMDHRPLHVVNQCGWMPLVGRRGTNTHTITRKHTLRERERETDRQERDKKVETKQNKPTTLVSNSRSCAGSHNLLGISISP